ncbi:MAG: putative threonine synthase [Bacteroidetes bacterium]|nr:putative threonine synthase [Bacteroidota bacterium]
MIPFRYTCTLCGRSFERDEVRYLCPVCGRTYAPGMPLQGVLEVAFDWELFRARWDPSSPDWDLFMPVEKEYFPPFPVGGTPLLRADRLGQELDLRDLSLKNDGLNPSGSLKDRASFLVVAEASRLGENRIVAASTGNAASALAAVCAASGKQALIFVPAAAPRAKLAQILLYGATLVPIDGSYDDAFRLSMEFTEAEGGLNRNTAYHPLTIEGKKTAGLEIFAQNGMKVPDVIVIPVGDGVILHGVHKAFADLRAAGLAPVLPRLLCVQSERSDAIHRYFTSGTYADAPSPDTFADSISVRTPSNAVMARRALLESRGTSVAVSDDEIRTAQAQLARTTGVFAEPAAAATIAGLRKMRESGWVSPDDHVVALITGHGLKDVDAALSGVAVPSPVAPELSAVQAVLAKCGQ